MPDSYRKALYYAIALHVLILLALLIDNSNKSPALSIEARNAPGYEKEIIAKAQPEVVKAVSVDNQQVMQEVNRLKQEREQTRQAELKRQQQLEQQAARAKQQRIKEQQALKKLKQEAERVAIARKKQEEEEKKRIKALADQKAAEAKRLKALQERQAVETKKLAELNKQTEIEKARAEKERADAQKEAAAARAEKLAQEEASAIRARQEKARIAGEVDKYKARIVNAIGRHWILPENTDSSLSSQFRIRLAPNGMVLDVTLTKSSGNVLLDRSAQTAIYKASPLPVPKDADAFNIFRDIRLTVRPEQIRG